MTEKKVFITPDTDIWILSDDERATVHRDDSSPPYTDGWFVISYGGNQVARLHKDEIERLYAFALGRNKMFYIVNEKTLEILEIYDTLFAPDPQEQADYFGCAIYIVRGEHAGLSATPGNEASDAH